MIDSDLARLFGVRTKDLNKAVARNAERFPDDFMFRLNTSETQFLRFQSGTSKNSGRGGRRYLPYAFSEHGAVMLASVLRSPTAVRASIRIARAFVKLRAMLAAHHELRAKFAELERRIVGHDESISSLFAAIRRLMNQPSKPRPVIGFRPEGG